MDIEPEEKNLLALRGRLSEREIILLMSLCGSYDIIWLEPRRKLIGKLYRYMRSPPIFREHELSLMLKLTDGKSDGTGTCCVEE